MITLRCIKATLAASLKHLPQTSTQMIWVQSEGGIKVKISACQKKGNSWALGLRKPFMAVVGTGGITRLVDKKEGDMKTLAGLYPVGEAFSSQPLALKMDFKYITAEDKFITDPHHRNYNTWVRGTTDAKHYENMWTHAYKIGLAIEYNTNPIHPGAGTAFFMHVWTSYNIGTHGGIATDQKHLFALLKWLDKKQHPYIFIESPEAK